MRIAFWSPMHGTGATANMLAVAMAVTQLSGRSVLLTQTNHSMNNLEKPLVGEIGGLKSGDFFRDTGIDAVVRYFKAGMLSKDVICNCSVDLSPNLVLLAGTKQNTLKTQDSQVMHRIVGHILNAAEQYYDWVVVDTESGYSEQSLGTVEEADIVVISLRQSRSMLDELFGSEKFKRLEGKKLFYLFGSYDADSKYNLANIRRLYKKINSANSGGLPHCTAYMDALCDSKALKYMTSNMINDADIEDEAFFSELEKISEKILAMSAESEGKG